jgi:hypothetical protein
MIRAGRGGGCEREHIEAESPIRTNAADRRETFLAGIPMMLGKGGLVNSNPETTFVERPWGESVSRHIRRCIGPGGLGLALVIAIGACGEPPPTATQEEALSAPTLAAGPATPVTGTVTLLTGDRVTLTIVGGHPKAQVQPGPGRDRIAFSIQDRAGDITVIPHDLAPLIGADRLDPALFDVTRLIADGYGDDRRDDLPLIVTRQPDLPALHSRLASSGVRVDRTLPPLHMMAVRQRKASAGAVLANLGAPIAPGAAITGGAAPPKIWLDRRRALLLDRSVPQIGAPAAYARGFTGAGVTVAVLDSGIDTTHPDLVGKVRDAETFVDDGLGTSDVFGHGTHVASIVAGTGAASGGRFHGVAPDATLVSGRVCDQFGGCPDSAILAGMAWAAATEHAPIVNLSLGGPDTPGIDPLEDAVNQLSAQFGTLFVIAAGNDGQRQTIASPGSADAALTVGAVDRDESLAFFSSQGPRIGDLAVKPDITAPGVGIVAARASGTAIGPVIDDFYVRLSGTSMATPHVAGAAAILFQQHPDWTGAQLKDALVGAANPNPALTVYQQGGGRVDVDRVTRQAVTADPTNLSLGIARFPHDDDPLLTRTVRYTNPGPAPVVLGLDAQLALAGQPAVPGMIAVSPPMLTVPAGGTADAVITVDTRGARPDGVYGGTLTATGGDVRIVTPVGVDRESESFDLTISMVGRDGQPATSLLFLQGIGDAGSPVSDVDLILFVTDPRTVRLPRGTYSIVMRTLVDSQDDDAVMVAPRFALAADTQLVVDGQLARPFDVTLPEPDLALSFLMWQFHDLRMQRTVIAGGFGPLASGEFGPSASPGEIESVAVAHLIPSREAPAGPATRIYNIGRSIADHFMTGWQQTIARNELATVQAHHAAADDQSFFKAVGAVPPLQPFIFTFGLLYTGPFDRTEFYFGDGFRWDGELQRMVTPDLIFTAETLDQVRDYRPGQSYVERWNRAPLGPAFAGPTAASLLPDFTGAPVRSGDTLVLVPSMFSDQAVPARGTASQLLQQRLTLSRDGQVIHSHSNENTFMFDSLAIDVPPEPALYRLEADATRPADLFPLSTHVTAAWTFHSQHADGAPQPLPVPMLRFLPELDDHNQTAARALVLPIQIDRPAGAEAPRIAQLHVEASFDDGATWTPVPALLLGDRAVGLVIHPRGATAVSLRGSAVDIDGNAVEQTIVRAYTLAPR